MKNKFKMLLNHSMNLRQGFGLLMALIMGIQVFCMAPALAIYANEIPNITADTSTWVADEAELMSPITKRTVNTTLGQIAKETGNQVHMVTVRGLNYGDSSQKLTDNLFDLWFPESESQANQTLIVVDSKTKTSGIRVGPQAEAVLTDELAKSVASESLLIPIRSSNYNEAFEDTANRLAALFSGEPDPGTPEVAEVVERKRNFRTADETNDSNATILVVVMLIIATVVPMVTYYYYQSN